MVFCLRQYVLGELRMPYPKPSGSNNCKTGTAHSILWNPSWPASLALEGLHHTGNGVQRICLRASKVDGYKTTAPEIWMIVWAYTKFDYVLQVSVRISTYQTVHLHLFSRPSPIRQAQYIIHQSFWWKLLLEPNQAMTRFWIPQLCRRG